MSIISYSLNPTVTTAVLKSVNELIILYINVDSY